ncbi:MAG TPA: hypothetical protein VHS56_11735 [Candidatus Cybelea sp.]|nr:hypothetical protein [Candidatus Cybelea sp.]
MDLRDTLRLSYCTALAASLALGACSGGVTPAVSPAGAPHGALLRPNSTTFYGCPSFKGHPYDDVITNARVDKHSADYINSMIQAGNTAGFYASIGNEQINLADKNTPLLTVQPKVKFHQFPVPYPWLSNFFIEPTSDHHAVVVQTQSCRVYESYGTTYASGSLGAYCGANWKLRGHFKAMPPGTPSAMASGLSLFAGMVRWEDYQSGAITHALDWTAIAHTVSEDGFVKPASDTDHLAFYGSSAYQLPYGARLRLKASFDTSGLGPQATMVIDAMKTYGIYLADTGTSSNGLYFSNEENGENPWSWSDLSALDQIKLSDFDVIKLPKLQSAP